MAPIIQHLTRTIHMRKMLLIVLLYGVQFTAAYGRLRTGHRLEPAIVEQS